MTITSYDAPLAGGAEPKDSDPIDEKKTVVMVEALFKKAKRARSTNDTTWLEDFKFLRGMQWQEKRPSYRHSEVLNFTNAAIQVMVAILTDSRPTIECEGEEPADYEFARIMTQILRARWDRAGFAQVVVEAVMDAATFGTAITEQPWDQDLLQGLGDYDFQSIDPTFVYPSPSAKDVNDKDCDYIVIARPLPIAQIKREYPDKAQDIKGDITELSSLKEQRYQSDDYRARSPAEYSYTRASDSGTGSKEDQCLKIECWMRDETMEEVEIEQEGGEKGFQTKKKYPNGRRICIASGTLLVDESNPYLDGKFPFARLVDYVDPRNFWGISELSQLKGPQRMINSLMSYVLDIVSLVGNPVWKVPIGSGVDPDSIINKPGLQIPYNDGAEPHREPGIDVQPSIFQALDRLVEWFERLSGNSQVSSGATPSANASGLAIGRLQEAAQTKLRLKGRNIEAWLTQAGQQMASRILQFYSIPRIVRITGDDNAPKYFKIAIDTASDAAGEVQQQTAVVQPMTVTVDATGQQVVIPDETRAFEIKGNLDIKVTIGTSLPFAKAEREQRAWRLFEAGIYDAEDLLTDIDQPRKEAILAKFNERQAQAAQAAQLQQAQGAVPSGI